MLVDIRVRLYFCIWQDDGIDKATEEFDAIKTAVKSKFGEKIDGITGTDLSAAGPGLATKVSEALKDTNIPGKIEKLIKTEFSIDGATVSTGSITTSGKKVIVTIGSGVGSETGQVVQVVFKQTSGGSGSATVELEVKNAKTGHQATRIAWRLGKVLKEITEVKNNTGTPINVKVIPQTIDGDS